MIKHGWKPLLCLLLMLSIFFSFPVEASAIGISQKESNQSVAAFAMSKTPILSAISSALPEGAGDCTCQGAPLSAEELQSLELYAGGMAFGVKFFTEGVTVVGFHEVETDGGKVNPAEEAGLKQKDVILKVNGEALTGASQLTQLIEGSEGRALTLSCRRGKNHFEVQLTPRYCPAEGRYKTGIWVRDSGAGIGTVTFVIPETGAFAGLGHGICDSDTGALVPIRRGAVSDVTIKSVVKGAAGAPGELKGYFNPGKSGSLLGNSTCGVWGVFSTIPEECDGELMHVATREEIQEGEASILCTLDSNEICKYAVEISNINRDATGPKCFSVKVTDKALLEKTGGIVQGMSGSPIIQNGKIVGAVTHVLINDPTTGYGIFIENMLNAVTLPMTRAS
jgi:stage IV sporulation protein B